MPHPQQSRQILRFRGTDTRDFLQGLITNDINKIDDGLVYAAILTPQGKYLADFFLWAEGSDVMMDTDAYQTDGLIQRLTMYKLRADVQINTEELFLHRGLAEKPEDSFTDPRSPNLGWRAYRKTKAVNSDIDWVALNIENLIPTSTIELTNDTFILEVGFERINGVDFRKGCYVGQEVTARMKHKTELRKGLALVDISGEAETNTEIFANGKKVGTLLSRTKNKALAYLRFDRVDGSLQAGDAIITWRGRP